MLGSLWIHSVIWVPSLGFILMMLLKKVTWPIQTFFVYRYEWLAAVSETSHGSLLLSSYQPLPLPYITRVSNITVSLSLLNSPYQTSASTAVLYWPHQRSPVTPSYQSHHLVSFSPSLIGLCSTQDLSQDVLLLGSMTPHLLGFPESLKGSQNLSWPHFPFTP